MMHNCISCPWMQNYTLHLTHSVSHSALSHIFECKKSTSGSIRLNCISPKIKPCIADTAFCIFSPLLHWNPLTYIRCKIAPLHCMDPSLNITPWTVLGMTHRSTHIWLRATSVLHTLNGCMRVMSRYCISIDNDNDCIILSQATYRKMNQIPDSSNSRNTLPVDHVA